MRKNELINPLFESLSKKAREYIPIPQFTIIKEQENKGSKMDPKDVESNLMKILDPLRTNIISNIQAIPYQDIKDKIMPIAMEGIIKLTNNASVDDLITALEKIWTSAITQLNEYYMNNPEDKKETGDIYKKVDEGVKACRIAYDRLKEKAGGSINDAELLKRVNSGMEKAVKGLQDITKTAKNTIEAAK